MRKFLGFTLTEIIISLGIIGAIVALTVPNVITNYQNKTNVTALRKLCNDINFAVSKYMTDQRADNLRDTQLRNDITGLTNHFDVASNCGRQMYNSNKNCFARYYAQIDNNDDIDLNGEECDVVFSTRSGAALCFSIIGNLTDSLAVSVDTNGIKKPNVLGRDLFRDIKIKNSGELYSNEGYFHDILDANWKMNY